jgi:hypothetical protein
LREAGRYLSAHPRHVSHAQALAMARQAEEWLAARGIAG